MPCVYFFRKGKNVGKQCGKGKQEYCKKHSKCVLQLSKFPRLVIHNIINQTLNFQSKDLLITLQNMSLTCTEFNDIIEPFWEILYKSLKIPKELDNYMSDLAFKYRCYLILKINCQKCDIPRTLRIYWPHPLRICPKCFKTVAIDEISIKVKYCIKDFTHDKCIILNNQNNQVKFYLIKDVEDKINCKLYEYHLNDHKREIASKLDLSYEELFNNSKKFVFQDNPNIKEIEKDYYRNLASEVFKEHLNTLKIYDMFSEPIKQEERSIYKLKNKQEFDDWKINLNNFEEIYRLFKKKDYYMFIYNRELKHINNILFQYNYIIEDVPDISNILEEYKDFNKPIKELEEVFIKIRHIVIDFVKKIDV